MEEQANEMFRGSVRPFFFGAALVGALAGSLQGMAEGGGEDMSGIKVPKLIEKLESGEQVVIVALGDSNTEQTFHTRGQMGWPYLLQTALFMKYGANRTIMINAGCCGEGAGGGLQRLDRDVLRFKPDLVIVCYWGNDMESLRKIVTRVREQGAEVLLRTPNPILAFNMPRIEQPSSPGQEWPGQSKAAVASNIVALAEELGVPVVDHYTMWIDAETKHQGAAESNPNLLWMRMSDAFHPGPQGHVAFYRELAPAFGLPTGFPWEF